MLNFDTVYEIMKKYGYSSTVHPFIYQNGDTFGICYSYCDDEYGQLERIKIFESSQEFEDFLKQLEWVKNNGKKYHVRMILDNYEAINPKVLFLRNEKIMIQGEMFDIDNFDLRESQRLQMDDVSKVIYEAGDLLLVYDEVKGRQLQYLKKVTELKNELRTMYYNLQKEVDEYNKYKIERTLNLLPDITDTGINTMMEIAIKDRYNLYVVQRPSYEEAVGFLKEVWELNKNLELNVKYYEAQKEETDIRNEMKAVSKKLDLMKKLNENLKPVFGIDLVSRFRKINKECSDNSSSISEERTNENINNVNRKYAFYDKLNLLFTSDYLREAIQNTNYEDLVIKYSKDIDPSVVKHYRKPPNEVAASLSIQYRDKLDIEEQGILVLYNNHKYRKLCDAILNIDCFESLPIKKLIGKVNNIKGFSKIKSECYDIVKKRLLDPVNDSIKKSLFNCFDFTSFETFMTSLVNQLVKLRNVNNKMILNGDVNMYLVVDKVEDISSKKFVMVTNDLNSLLNNIKGTKSMIGVVLLKENTPVLYSPYYFDAGDIYSKGASLQMNIKEMINFEMLVDVSDIIVNTDPMKVNVVRYYSEPITIDNVSIVDDIKMSYKTTFCKYSLTSNLTNNNFEVVNDQVDAQNIQNAELSASVSLDGVGVTTIDVSEQSVIGDVSNGQDTAKNSVDIQSDLSKDINNNENIDVEQGTNGVLINSNNMDSVTDVKQEVQSDNQDVQSKPLSLEETNVVKSSEVEDGAPSNEVVVNSDNDKVSEEVKEVSNEDKLAETNNMVSVTDVNSNVEMNNQDVQSEPPSSMVSVTDVKPEAQSDNQDVQSKSLSLEEKNDVKNNEVKDVPPSNEVVVNSDNEKVPEEVSNNGIQQIDDKGSVINNGKEE